MTHKDALAIMKKENEANLPSGDAGGGALLEYFVDETSFRSDEDAGREIFTANVVEEKLLANEMITARIGAVVEVQNGEAYIDRV